jgi:hypothetical protein
VYCEVLAFLEASNTSACFVKLLESPPEVCHRVLPIGEVQRFAEKRGVRRILGRSHRSGVHNLELEKATAAGLNYPSSSPGEHKTVGKLAEGEELGSNLLRVVQRTLTSSKGLILPSRRLGQYQ